MGGIKINKLAKIGTASGNGAGDLLLTISSSTQEVGQVSNTLASLPTANVFIGNSLNQPQARVISGAIIINESGVTSLGSGVVTNANISNGASIGFNKLAPLTDSKVVVTGPDGFLTVSTVTPTELLNLAGTTSPIQSQIDSKQETITGAASTVTTTNLSPNIVAITNGAGKFISSTVPASALGFISTLTSDAQTQINQRLPVSLGVVAAGDLMWYNGTAWTNIPRGNNGQALYSTGSGIQWNTPTINGIPTGGTVGQYLKKNTGTDFDTSWDSLTVSDISGLSASDEDLNTLQGASAAGLTSTKVVFLSSITSDLQTQLNNKLNNSLSFNSLWVGSVTNQASQLTSGTNGQVLTIVGGSPTWQTPVTSGNVSGPGSSTPTALARWNGTGGNALNDSTVLLDASGNIINVSSLQTVNQGGVILRELTANGTNSVTLRAAASMTADYTITLPSSAPSSGQVLGFNGTDYVWTVGGGGGGITDGDKGDITVTASGATWTVDPQAITYAKIQNVTNNRLLGNFSGSAASTQEIQIGSTLSVSAGVLQTNALTGDVTSSANSFATTIANGAVTFAKMQSSAASGLSVVGRSVNSSGSFAEINAASDFQILRRSGGSVGFGSIDLSQSGAVGSSILSVANGGTGVSSLTTLWGSLPIASPTVSGIARLYNDLTNSNTDGAVTQSAIKSSFDNLFIQQSPATGGATITIDCAGRRQVLALLSTLSASKAIAINNSSSTIVLSILLNVTGTITLTFPSTFRAEQSEVRWNNTTKALTLTGVTATPFELGAIWDGTFWRLKVTQDFYTS